MRRGSRLGSQINDRRKVLGEGASACVAHRFRSVSALCSSMTKRVDHSTRVPMADSPDHCGAFSRAVHLH